MAWLAGLTRWWRRLWADDEPADDGPSAAEVMAELREARAQHAGAHSRTGRPRSVRTALTAPPAPTRYSGSGTATGAAQPTDGDAPGRAEVPWFEVQRRQAAIRDDLAKDDYDEAPRNRP